MRELEGRMKVRSTLIKNKYLKWRNFGADLIWRNQNLFKFRVDLI